MNTKKLTINQVKEAGQILKNGGLVAIPTETVYGLAADALNGRAVANIFKAKGRPMDNPLIIHIANLDQLCGIVSSFPTNAKKLAKAFWPGPLTIIMPKSDKIPFEVSAGLDTVAVRYPSHKVAQEVILESGPLAAPSANLSGSPSPTTAEHVLKDLDGKIDAVLDGGSCDVGLESTVVTVVTDPPRLLRPGGITLSQLKEVLGEVEVDPAVLNKIDSNEKVSSPGMKYKHYAPKAKVILIKSSKEKYIDYINKNCDEHTAALCYDDDIKSLNCFSISYGKEDNQIDQAKNLFAALREFDDKKDIKIIYARCPNPEGIGMAVYNRLIRAAGFEMLNL